MALRELLDQRSRIVAEMRQITESPSGNGGDLSDDQSARFDTLKSELRGVEQKIERQQTVDDAERRMQGQQITTSGDDRFDAELRSFSLVRAMAAMCPDLAAHVDAGREREVSAELARRAGRQPQGILVPLQVFERRVTTTTNPVGGPGSNLIATDLRGDLYIDALRAALRVRQMGATVLSGLVGNVDIPRLKTSAVAGWVAENQALSTSDLGHDKVTLSPRHAGCITEFSRNMLMQSSPDIEQLVRTDFAHVLAEAVDRVAIKGGGTNEPTGILGTSGIGSVAMGTNGAALTYDAVADLIGAVEDVNVDGATGFLTNTKVKRAVAKMKDANENPLGADVVFQGQPRQFSNLVPSNGTKGTGTNLSSLIYGKWSDLLLGYWSAFDLLVNPYESTAYSKGNISVRGMLTMDVDVRHAESFAAITDIVA